MMTAKSYDKDDHVGDDFTPATSFSCDFKTKQQQKEEGRRRALEIAMARQQESNQFNSEKVQSERKNGKRSNRKSARHGARNQHRHKIFARWILDRFPHVLEECIDRSADEQPPVDSEVSAEGRTPMHILDVAGGKGELSARLTLCHSLNVVMIDPRPADVESVYMKSVVPKLPNKWQKSIEERLQQSPTFVHDLLEKRFSQLVEPFYSPSPGLSVCNPHVDHFEDEKLDAAVRNASLLIGLHADGATEAIVDAALLYRKPFVVVPCCVFPNLFRERYLSVSIDDGPKGSSSDAGGGEVQSRKRVPVRTHDQFCKYLLAKDPNFVLEVLPFDGRNVAIWWNGRLQQQTEK
ncbi:hypothetical protein ACHAWF_014796 [Thalassiosira exigua]